MKKINMENVKSRARKIAEKSRDLLPKIATAAMFMAGGYIIGEEVERKGYSKISVETNIQQNFDSDIPANNG